MWKKIRTLSALSGLALMAAFPMCSRYRPIGPYERPAPPRLVVGIVVDQMQYDYLGRFWPNFGEGGFKRLVGEGTSFTACNYNYVPTETAPGHASVFTGTTPSRHGIIMNDWIDQETIAARQRRTHSSVHDPAHPFAGLPAGRSEGKGASPKWLLAPTMADAVKAADPGAKAVGVSLKDRSAILPAGKSADAAYWFDAQTGRMVSSNYYPMAKAGLPAWVDSVNALAWPLGYLRDTAGWQLLLPAARYLAPDGPADARSEGGYSAEHGPYFPHRFGIDPEYCCGDFATTPWGNTFLKDFAKVAVVRHGLGMDDVLDFMSLSFSSTDMVGHQFGIESRELEDTYLRLDRDLADFLAFLDARVGRGRVMVFLTADHGGAPSPEVLMGKGEGGGWMDMRGLSQRIHAELGDVPGKDSLMAMVKGHTVYLNRRVAAARHMDIDSLARVVADVVKGHPGVLEAYAAKDVLALAPGSLARRFLGNGWHSDRSGDVLFLAQYGYQATIYANSEPYRFHKGTTHGTHFDYDTHVPFLLWGPGIPAGKVDTPAEITDIAPTVCARLGIAQPAMATGRALEVD